MEHPGYSLIYKMYKNKGKYHKCVLDLSLGGRGNDIEFLRKRYANKMEADGIEIHKTGKSASFRLHVPFIEPPTFDEKKVCDAFRVAKKLKSWWEDTRIEGD